MPTIIPLCHLLSYENHDVILCSDCVFVLYMYYVDLLPVFKVVVCQPLIKCYLIDFITARCYASAVLAMALCLPVCLSVCLSVRHKSVFY